METCARVTALLLTLLCSLWRRTRRRRRRVQVSMYVLPLVHNA